MSTPRGAIKLSDKIISGSDIPNDFYSVFEEYFHRVFGDLLALNEGDIDPLDYLYVTSRIVEPSPVQIEAHRAALGLQRGQDPFRLGSAELELLHFLHTNRTAGVLCLHGHVGSGKSCLLHYALARVSRLPCLDGLHPVLMDCRQSETKDLEFTDLAQLLRRAILARPFPTSSPTLDRAAALLDFPIDVLQIEQTDARIRIGRALEALSHDRVVITFDNVDHLSPRATTRVMDLAFSCYYGHNLLTILALRPTSYHQLAEIDRGRQAFTFFRMYLSAPNLRSVLAARVAAIQSIIDGDPLPLSKKFSLMGKTFSLRDTKASLDALFDNLLTPSIQDFIYNLTDYGTRSALLAFDRLLRARELPLPTVASALLPSLDSHSAIIPGGAFPPRGEAFPLQERHLDSQNALPFFMIYSLPCYRGDIVVPNLFELGTGEGMDRLVLFRLLSIAKWFSGMGLTSEARRILQAFRHGESIIDAALSLLLQSKILYSPESDGYMGEAVNMCITTKGDLFFSEILSNPKYLLHAVDDCTLPFGDWRGFSNYYYQQRMSRVVSLLAEIIRAERTQVKEVLASKSPECLAILCRAGLLSSRLAEPAHALFESGKASRFEMAVKAALRSGPAILRFISDAGKIQKTVRASISNSPLDGGFLTNVLEIQPNGHLEVVFPRRLLIGSQDFIDLRLRGMSSGSQETQIVAICQIDSTSIVPRRQVETFGQSLKGERTCRIDLSMSTTNSLMPQLRIRVFRDGQPVGSVNYHPSSSI